jgi:hypothetical protein
VTSGQRLVGSHDPPPVTSGSSNLTVRLLADETRCGPRRQPFPRGCGGRRSQSEALREQVVDRYPRQDGDLYALDMSNPIALLGGAV